VRDAVPRDPSASYAHAAAAPLVTDVERAVVSAQLGRPARGRSSVVHRCRFGLPTTVRVGPHLDDGTPFPTVFWLTCPVARHDVGVLEASGAMVGVNARLDDEPTFAEEYAAGHVRYVRFRDALGEPLAGDPGAGGMPAHVKCLHTHLAHHLATGDNPVGAWTFDRLAPFECPTPCVAPPDEP